MSPNRKADLQRKLAMAPIPKPPAGLAERIKSEIPQHLLVDARKERQRLSQSIAFNLRVAASVILLVSSVYLALRFLSHEELERAAMEKPSNVVLNRKAAPPPASPARVAESTAPPAAHPALAPPPKPVAPQASRERVLVAEAKTEPLAKKEEARDTATGGSAMAGNAAPPPVPMVPPAPAPPASVVAEAATAAPRAAAKAEVGFVTEARADALALAPSTLFDIVVPRADAALRGAALIQHFAAPPAPPRSLRLEAEAATLEETALLRVSVDTPERAHPEGGSRPPVASDAKLDVVFDDDVVASHRPLAGRTTSTESALPSGTSVTAMFEVELKPDVAPRATIANVTLRYRSVADGKEHVLTRKLRRSDLHDWETASRRMKSASLAAALADSLEPAAKIAEKARAAGLDELAAIAEKQ
jgi:hypothetical protein